MKYVDLHIHTNASDGSKSPTDVVTMAYERNLAAIAITDHDTVSGIDEAMIAGADKDIEIICGIELSASYKDRDIHLLGLFIDRTNPSLLETLAKIKKARDERNYVMLDRINNMGYDLDYSNIEDTANGEIVTRAHFAKALVIGGYIKDYKYAFDNIIGYGCPAYVKRYVLTTKEALHLILDCGGVPILAHPILYGFTDNELDELVSDLKDHGLKGLEAIYSFYTYDNEIKMRRLARKYNLAISGGSDYHGKIRPDVDLGRGRGKLKIPYYVLEELKNHIPHLHDFYQ